MWIFYCIGKIEDFYVYNKVKLPQAVPIAKQLCTCGEATFLIKKYNIDKLFCDLYNRVNKNKLYSIKIKRRQNG